MQPLREGTNKSGSKQRQANPPPRPTMSPPTQGRPQKEPRQREDKIMSDFESVRSWADAEKKASMVGLKLEFDEKVRGFIVKKDSKDEEILIVFKELDRLENWLNGFVSGVSVSNKEKE